MQMRKFTSFLIPDKLTFLVLCWSFGLSFGIYVGTSLSDILSVLLRSSCYTGSTLIVPAAIIPITLVWIASRHSMSGFIYPILFLKAFFDGIVLLGIAEAFGSAAWLMGLLALMTDRFATVILLYYASRCLQTDARNSDKLFFVLILLIIVISVFDYFLISGNLINLIP